MVSLLDLLFTVTVHRGTTRAQCPRYLVFGYAFLSIVMHFLNDGNALSESAYISTPSNDRCDVRFASVTIYSNQDEDSKEVYNDFIRFFEKGVSERTIFPSGIFRNDAQLFFISSFNNKGELEEFKHAVGPFKEVDRPNSEKSKVLRDTAAHYFFSVMKPHFGEASEKKNPELVEENGIDFVSIAPNVKYLNLLRLPELSENLRGYFEERAVQPIYIIRLEEYDFEVIHPSLLVGRQVSHRSLRSLKTAPDNSKFNITPVGLAMLMVVFFITIMLVIGLTCLLSTSGPKFFSDKGLAVHKTF